MKQITEYINEKYLIDIDNSNEDNYDNYDLNDLIFKFMTDKLGYTTNDFTTIYHDGNNKHPNEIDIYIKDDKLKKNYKSIEILINKLEWCFAKANRIVKTYYRASNFNNKITHIIYINEKD